MAADGSTDQPATSSSADLESALRDSQARLRDLFETSLAGVYRTTAAGRILDCNPAFARTFGYEREELVQRRAQDLYLEVAHRDDNLERLRAAGQVASGEIAMRRRDGSPVWVVFSERIHRLPGGEEVIEGTLIDVSARRVAELALRESQGEMEQALRAARAGAWRWELQSGRARWSDENFQLLGYAPGSVEASYQAWRARVHPDDLARTELAVSQAMAGRADLDVQFRVVWPDGSIHWIRDVGRLTLDAAGAPTGMSGIQLDVTERARTEEALRISQQRLQSLVCEVPVVLFALDREGVFTLSEGRGLAALGLQPGEVVGRSALETYRDFPAVVASLRRALAGEMTRATLDIGPLVFDTVFTPLRGSGGEADGVIGVALDVSERRRAEEEMRRTQKLDSIGVLAGGLAHDFNNLLTAILANVALAREAATEAERAEVLADAESACGRARELTRQLLTFARGGAPLRRVVSLPRILREVLGFALAGTPVKGELAVDPDLWPVEADEGQLVQVLNNLLLNAAQSMPRGGRVTLRARNRPASAEAGAGPAVLLSVEDEGTGIRPEDLPRIFDPYFTTKQKGSGLGLAIAHSVVRAHGGRFQVESRLGQGSTFAVELPASPGGLAVEPAAGGALPHGRGRVLVMDDEPMVRAAASRALARLGYQVAGARDGAEAIALYQEARRTGQPFDAVILDLTVPGGMGGRETMAHLLGLDPAVKAVVSSGYASESVMAEHRAHGFVDFVEKPWRPEDLGAVLRRVLGP